MDAKEPFKNELDQLKDAKSEDPSQSDISTDNPNPLEKNKDISESKIPIQERDDKPGSKVEKGEPESKPEDTETKVKKNEPESMTGEKDLGTKLKREEFESNPGEKDPGTKVKKDQPESMAGEKDPEIKVKKDELESKPGVETVTLYLPGPLLSASYARPDKLESTPKSNKGLRKKTSIDSSGTGESGSKSESPKASSDSSGKGSIPKSSETPSKSELPSSDSFDTEVFSDAPDSGRFTGKETESRKGSGTSSILSSSETSKSKADSSRGKAEPGQEAFPKTSSPEGRLKSNKASQSPSIITTPSSEEEVLLVDHPDADPPPPPGDVPRDLPGDAPDRGRIPPPQPPPPEINEVGNPDARIRPPNPPPSSPDEDNTGRYWGRYEWLACLIFSILGVVAFFVILIEVYLSKSSHKNNANDTLANETFTNETFTNETFTNETVTNATNLWIIPGLNGNLLP